VCLGTLISAPGCITPTRYVTVSDGEEHRYEVRETRTETRAGKYVFTASNVELATSSPKGMAAEPHVIVCVVADDVPWPGRLRVGDGCRVYLVRFLTVGLQRARAISGDVYFDKVKWRALPLGLDVVLEPEDGQPRFRLKGRIDFEPCFTLLHTPLPDMEWAINEELQTAVRRD
jgi:hypothetical protein